MLLEYIWRRYQPDPDDGPKFQTLTHDDVVKGFGTDKIDRILGIFLPMDKANAFYKMVLGGQLAPGMSWYSKLHKSEDMKENGVVPNPFGHGLLNHRNVLLARLCNDYLKQSGLPPIGQGWIHLLQPDKPPSDRFQRLGIEGPH